MPQIGPITLNPPVKIHPHALHKAFDVVLLSHDHPDHFSVPSLHLLDRSCLVIYPEGAHLLKMAFARLGFHNTRTLRPGESTTVDALQITATPSDVPFPEIGFIFTTENRTLFNMVDTMIEPETIREVLEPHGQIDLLLAKYCPNIELEHAVDTLGSAFPYTEYHLLLKNVLATRARCVIPTACGFAFAPPFAWLTDRSFPVDYHKFLADLRAIAPETVTAVLSPGEAIDVDTLDVHPGRLGFLEALSPHPSPQFDWRLDRGVPPLHDHNPDNIPVDVLRQAIFDYLDGHFLVEQTSTRLHTFRDQMRSYAVTWRLLVVFPGGEEHIRILRYSNSPLKWEQASGTEFANITTAVTASGLYGVLKGSRHIYDVALTSIRASFRVYQPSKTGIDVCDEKSGPSERLMMREPLLHTLIPGATERHVDYELRQLGF